MPLPQQELFAKKRAQQVTPEDASQELVSKAEQLFSTLQQMHRTVDHRVIQYASRSSFHSLLPLSFLHFHEEQNPQPQGDASEFMYYQDSSGQSYTIHYDAAFSFGLQTKDRPLFICSFDISAEDTLLVRQFQGINPQRFGPGARLKTLPNHSLGLFDWKRYSLETIALLGSSLGFIQLGIQASQHNEWTKQKPYSQKSPHLPLERAKKIYDTYALQNGFSPGKDGHFYTTLNRYI